MFSSLGRRDAGECFQFLPFRLMYSMNTMHFVGNLFYYQIPLKWLNKLIFLLTSAIVKFFLCFDNFVCLLKTAVMFGLLICASKNLPSTNHQVLHHWTVKIFTLWLSRCWLLGVIEHYPAKNSDNWYKLSCSRTQLLYLFIALFCFYYIFVTPVPMFCNFVRTSRIE